MGTDNQLDILIKIIADRTGAQLTKQDIAEIKAATKDAGAASVKANEEGGEAVKKHIGHIGGMHRALHVLGNQFGEVGHIAAAAFRGPLIAAIIALVALFQKLSEAGKQLAESLKGSAEEAAKPIGDMAAAAKKIKDDIIASNKLFKESQEQLHALAAAVVADIEAESEASKKLLAARKSLAMAAAHTPEAKAAVEAKFSAAEEAAKGRTEAQIIAIKEQELAEQLRQFQAKQAEAKKNLGGRSPDQARAVVEDLEGRKKSFEDAGKEAQKLLDYIEKANPVDMVELLRTYGTVQGIIDAKSQAQGSVARSKSGVATIVKGQDRLRAGIAASEAGDTLPKDIVDLTNDIRHRRQSATADWQAQGMGKPGGQAILDAAAGADAVRSGSRATTEQAAAIAEAIKNFGLQGQSQETILRILGGMNDSNKKFQNALNVLESRLNNMSQWQ